MIIVNRFQSHKLDKLSDKEPILNGCSDKGDSFL